MRWETPPLIKVYEALGAIADGRIEVSGNSAKLYSSSRQKFYTVTYDPARQAIMANDNGSYWKGYLGYPSIALLMKLGVVSCPQQIVAALKGIPWKDIATKHQNDWDQVVDEALRRAEVRGFNSADIRAEAAAIYQEIQGMRLSLLGQKMKPPAGY